MNEACGGYYNFGLHTEHSRPHIARVIDFTFGIYNPVGEFVNLNYIKSNQRNLIGD